MTASSQSQAPVVGRHLVPSNPGTTSGDLRHKFLLLTSDVVALIASASLGAWTLSHFIPDRAGRLGISEVAVSVISLVAAFRLHGLYRRPASRLRPSRWWRTAVVARALPTAVLITLAVDALVLHGGRMTLTAAVVMAVPAAILVPAGRRLVTRKLSPTVPRILVLGTGPISDRLTSRLKRCNDVCVVGHVDDDVQRDEQVLGGIAELADVCIEHRIDRIVVAFPRSSQATVLEALRGVEGQVFISEVPRYFELHNWRSETEDLEGLTIFNLPGTSLGTLDRVLKRLLDLTLSTCALVVAAPILLVIAIAIKLDSPGPVLYRQERTGRRGQTFRIFKFRSMTADTGGSRDSVAHFNEADGPMFKIKDDPRITHVGAIIRRTSLDELPQFINVIRGEMSLVGPRPFPTEDANRIDGAALARLDVKPGITGLWQVSGRSDLTYADLQHLDSIYVRSWSLIWDLRILLKTPQTVFKRDGAY